MNWSLPSLLSCSLLIVTSVAVAQTPDEKVKAWLQEHQVVNYDHSDLKLRGMHYVIMETLKSHVMTEEEEEEVEEIVFMDDESEEEASGTQTPSTSIDLWAIHIFTDTGEWIMTTTYLSFEDLDCSVLDPTLCKAMLLMVKNYLQKFGRPGGSFQHIKEPNLNYFQAMYDEDWYLFHEDGSFWKKRGED